MDKRVEPHAFSVNGISPEYFRVEVICEARIVVSLIDGKVGNGGIAFATDKLSVHRRWLSVAAIVYGPALFAGNVHGEQGLARRTETAQVFGEEEAIE